MANEKSAQKSRPHQVSKGGHQNRKVRNRAENEVRHQVNLDEVANLGLMREEVVTTKTYMVKGKGGKVEARTMTKVKNKRPSKLLRKFNRTDRGERYREQAARIAALEAKVAPEKEGSNEVAQ